MQNTLLKGVYWTKEEISGLNWIIFWWPGNHQTRRFIKIEFWTKKYEKQAKYEWIKEKWMFRDEGWKDGSKDKKKRMNSRKNCKQILNMFLNYNFLNH